jgi:hypothetical protein
MTLSDLSEEMRSIDFAMLSTRTEGGEIAGRPMSNNGDVVFDGDSYFFTYEQSRTVADIRRDPKVSLSFQGKAGLLGKPPIFIAIEGQAELIRDKQPRILVREGRRYARSGPDQGARRPYPLLERRKGRRDRPLAFGGRGS